MKISSRYLFVLRGAVAKRILGVRQLAALGVGTCLLGCQSQAAFPVLDKVEQVVAADLAGGASDQQMASDVCAALGGTATTDAVCADVATIIQDTIAMLIDSGALKGAALENAKSKRAGK